MKENLIKNCVWSAKKIVLTMLIFSITTSLTMATPVDAKIEVTGKITDEDGVGLPGASILEKGTLNGTITDADGNYKITCDENSTLTISFIGFETKEIAVNGQSVISLSLAFATGELEEVVVVGYGTAKKSDLTGSVSSVSSDDYEMQPIQRIDQAIQGRAAGVTVQQTSGNPRGGFKIRVRGANSISGNNEPLYVVDGIITGDIVSLNLDDIESMEILKDASATAIYGSRGAAGVVLITTKRGKKGKPTVELATNVGLANVVRELPMLSPGDYAEGVNALEINEGGSAIYTDQNIADLRSGVLPSADWQDLLFREAAYSNTRLSIGGGNENMDYYVAGSFLDRDGIIVDQNFQRYTMRANVNAQLSPKSRLTINTNYTREENTGVRANLYAALTKDITTPAFDENGDYVTTNSIWAGGAVGNGAGNPLIGPENNVSDNFDDYLYLTTAFDYQIANNLTLNISGGLMDRHTTLNRFTSSLINNNANGWVENRKRVRLQNTNRLTYNLDRENHALKVDLVHEQQSFTNRWTRATSAGFFTDQVTFNDLSIGTLQTTTNGQQNEGIQSVLGRVNYTLMDRFLFTASVRADGSSKFREGQQWGYFPSASVAWRLTDEKFMENVGAISNLKLRLSHGQIGSQGIGVFATRDIPILGRGVNYFFDGDSPTIGIAPSNRQANPNLTWETTTQTDLGIDLGLFNSRLNLAVDLYYKKTSDLLLERILPPYVGPSIIAENVGVVENQGVDITLDATIVDKRDWDISTTLTYSMNRNNVLELYDNVELLELGNRFGTGNFPVNPTAVQLGQPISSFRGYIFEGVWQANEADEAAGFGAEPGMAKYQDVDGDGVITADDIVTVGDGNPDFTLGWNWAVSYKNLNLNFLLLGSYGNDIYNFTRMRMMSLGSATFHATHADWGNRWTPDNPSNIPNRRTGTQTLSTQFLEDGSFLSMKNITLSYDINLARFGFIKGLNISASAENLFILTNYTGFDPESTASGNSDVDLGIDQNSFPLNRIFSMGLRASF
ncbi:MAG: TonB-dependent receptor [Bacteroidota bacterium]